ncbi:MAG: RecX family transcriptional regulator [Bacteroidota bacterium]|nr:MAG: RecX family transcriptional regulator [Bacteroidota bacterium]
MEVRKQINSDEALEKLKYLCSKAEKCLLDIKTRLDEWDLSGEFDNISQILTSEKYIDEARYTQAFVNDKIRQGKWGKHKIRYLLKRKGIAPKSIETCLVSFPAKEYKTLVIRELQKKNNTIKETNPYKRYQKLSAFAAQRGYETEFLREILDNTPE